MSESTDQLDAKFEEASLQLNDGLTSCRSVVKDYRALILGVRASASDSRDARPERGPDADEMRRQGATP